MISQNAIQGFEVSDGQSITQQNRIYQFDKPIFG